MYLAAISKIGGLCSCIAVLLTISVPTSIQTEALHFKKSYFTHLKNCLDLSGLKRAFWYTKLFWSTSFWPPSDSAPFDPAVDTPWCENVRKCAKMYENYIIFFFFFTFCDYTVIITSGFCFVINVEMKDYFAEHCSTLYIIIHYLYIK